MDTTTIIQTAMILLFMWFCFVEIRKETSSGSGISIPIPKIDSQQVLTFLVFASVGGLMVYLYNRYWSGKREGMTSDDTSLLGKMNSGRTSKMEAIEIELEKVNSLAELESLRTEFNSIISKLGDDDEIDANNLINYFHSVANSKEKFFNMRNSRSNSNIEDDFEYGHDGELGANSGQTFYSYMPEKVIKELTSSYQPKKCIPHGKRCPPCPTFSQSNHAGYLTNYGWSKRATSVMHDKYSDLP